MTYLPTEAAGEFDYHRQQDSFYMGGLGRRWLASGKIELIFFCCSDDLFLAGDELGG